MLPDDGNAELTGHGAEREIEPLAPAQDPPRAAPWRPGDDLDERQRPAVPRGPAEEPEHESEAATQARAEEPATDGADAERPVSSPKPRRPLLIGAGVVLALGFLAWVGTLQPVETILRQSFTRLPTPYTEMYFSGTPTVSGITLSVPVTVVDHATTQDSFTLRVWTQNAAGKTDATTLIKVTPKHGQSTVVVKVAVQMPPDAQVLWIGLAGQSQTLHYRIAGQAIPSPTAKLTAPAGH